MLWFIFCIALLIGGYFIYGRVVEKVFGIRPARKTPAHELADGVDFVPMTKKRIWLIQLLNIAGTGPIFGPILGALYGPVAMLWIVFGCIFAGAVHDYFCGMLSIRNNGEAIPSLAGRFLGRPFKVFMNFFAVILLLLVGVVFVASPAGLLTNITGSFDFAKDWSNASILIFWTAVIFVYYFLATIVPIDKIIGRVYPIFGALLLFMSFGMIIGLAVSDISFFNSIPDMTSTTFFENLHPNNLPLWPLLFVTIACGAVSGFHATQTPLMARCVDNEKEARFVFYGAMIAEGVIALIWCMVGLSFYKDPAAMNEAIAAGTPSKVIYDSSIYLLGGFGGILAVLGVVVLPITSGDTSFRAARLIIAEFLKYDQKKHLNRLVIAVPLFVIGYFVSKVDFQILWRYFGWANQTTAMVMLWVAAAYCYRTNKFHWICTIPAMFMTMVCSTFLAYAKIGFGLSYDTSVIVGFAVTIISTLAFLMLIPRNQRELIDGAETKPSA